VVAPAPTEFSTKVGVLAGLAVVCAARPVVERLVAARGGRIRVPAFAMVVAVVMGAGLLFVAGVRARPTDAVSRPVAGERFVGPAAAIPSVTIDPAVHRIAASVTSRSAQAIGQDVVAELSAKGGASYAFDQMTLVLVRNPLRPQDAPRIGMAVHGTRNGRPTAPRWCSRRSRGATTRSALQPRRDGVDSGRGPSELGQDLLHQVSMGRAPWMH